MIVTGNRNRDLDHCPRLIAASDPLRDRPQMFHVKKLNEKSAFFCPDIGMPCDDHLRGRLPQAPAAQYPAFARLQWLYHH